MYFSYPDSHCSCLSTALRNLWQIFNILVFKIPHHGANPASYRRNWPARRDRNAPKHEKQNDSDVQYKAPLTTTTTCYSSPQITTIYTLAFQPAMDNTLQSHSWRSKYIDLNWKLLFFTSGINRQSQAKRLSLHVFLQSGINHTFSDFLAASNGRVVQAPLR